MKIRTHVAGLLSLGMVTFLPSVTAFAAGEVKPLESQVKISRMTAEKAALKEFHGSVKQSMLEKADGKLVWSFDIKRPGFRLREVHVNADTGQVISTRVIRRTVRIGESKSNTMSSTKSHSTY